MRFFRALAESREKARMDYEDNYNGAYKEGLQEGEQKGRLEGMKEVALKALRENLSVETVVRLTGLTPAAVKQLAAKFAE
jgi:predicted transposase/invertase (TIGR01784 family)